MHSVEYFTNLKEDICLRGCFSVACKGNVVRCKVWIIVLEWCGLWGKSPQQYIFMCVRMWKYLHVCGNTCLCVCVGLTLMFIIALQFIDLGRVVTLKPSLPVPDPGDLVSASWDMCSWVWHYVGAGVQKSRPYTYTVSEPSPHWAISPHFHLKSQSKRETISLSI